MQARGTKPEGSLYGPEYFQTHCGPIPYDRSYPHWLQFFGSMADEIIRSLRPRKVLDVGCGKGFLVECLRDRGVEAYGFDISEYAIGEVRPDIRRYCSVGSTGDPIEGHYDLITCIEVLEHVSEAEAILAIQNMSEHTGRILFSSTPYDFSEPTNQNVQAVIWWLRNFAKHSFTPDWIFDANFVTTWAFLAQKTKGRTPDEHLVLFSRFLDLKERLRRTDAELGERGKQLEMASTHLQEQKSSLDQQRHQIVELNGAVQEEEEMLQTLTSQVSEQEQGIGALSSELSQKEQAIQTLASQVDQKEQALGALSSELNQKEQAIQTLASQVGQNERSIQDLRTSLAQREEAARNSEAALNQIGATLSQIQSSHGWKILQYYYRLRDKLLPEGSRRRNWIKFVWRVATRQRVSLANFRDYSSRGLTTGLRPLRERLFPVGIRRRIVADRIFHRVKPVHRQLGAQPADYERKRTRSGTIGPTAGAGLEVRVPATDQHSGADVGSGCRGFSRYASLCIRPNL